MNDKKNNIQQQDVNLEKRGYIPSFPVSDDGVKGGFIPSSPAPAPIDITPSQPPPPPSPNTTSE